MKGLFGVVRSLLSSRVVQALFSATVSVVFLIGIYWAVDWKGALDMLQRGVHWPALGPFVVMAALITAAYGYRWQVLSRVDLSYADACRATVLTVGGNMLLPARGGDLLRVHFTFVATQSPLAPIVSKLFVEKIIDLAALVALGVLALAMMGAVQASGATALAAGVIATSVLIICVAVLPLQIGRERLLRLLSVAFAKVHGSAFFERHIAPLLRDASQTLKDRVMVPLGLLTFAMWLCLYAPAYMLSADFVGVPLSYHEALFVLFAGALSLMIPAAPSGIGTFHASIVSAFALLGRSTAEGLVFAAAAHLLFFVVFVIPAGLVMWQWRFRRPVTRYDMKEYLYALLRKYLGFSILSGNSVIEVDPMTPLLAGMMPNGKVTFRSADVTRDARGDFSAEKTVDFAAVAKAMPDYVLVSGLIHYERDIQKLLAEVHGICAPETRLILTYYSSLWRPAANLASRLGWRSATSEANWLAHEDIVNLLTLEDFELVRVDQRVLIPFYVPLVSAFVNRYLAPLPGFRNLCFLNIALARPLSLAPESEAPSVSIVVPARNEAGNIENIVRRIPTMGPRDEIIFIEGNSTDATWQTIQDVQARYGRERRILIGQQGGKGKGDAVRKGFAMASNEILMILDADITVPPEDLPKFYNAIKEAKGEFINGSRLVYPMEKRAMRFLNLLGNKFFAMAFSFLLGQRFKDTLCGTKVITRSNYIKLQSNRSYFGDFDPFGDFDLIFGAARMGLKIIEVPIVYRERLYGETNISRWRHGAILLAMMAFAARRIKFI